MTQQLTETTDALTRGELRFALVEAFNADAKPTKDSINVNGKPYYGNGSRDMTGTVRLMDGTLLPFAYVDGRFPIREGDLIRWKEEDGRPGSGGPDMSWPFESEVLLVEVQDRRVRRWTWPGVVLSDTPYHIGDHRYLEISYDDRSAIRFLGLHCVIDLAVLKPDWVEELVGKQHPDFPPAAVYVGHYADYYVEQATQPHQFAIFAWDQAAGMSHFVCFDKTA